MTPRGRRVRLVKLLEWLFTSLCVLGCSGQIITMINYYFQYRTTSVIQLFIPDYSKTDSLTLCVRFTDILDYKAIARDNSSRRWTASPDHLKNVQSHLSIKEIFKYTPSASEVIERVRFRRQGSYNLFNCTRAHCLEFFSVTKFIFINFICFTIKSIYSNETISYEALAITPSCPNEILEVELSSSMDRSSAIKILFHTADTLPHNSLPFAPVKRRSYDSGERRAKYNSFIAASVKLKVQLLPPPYETKCRDYLHENSLSRTHSIERCMKDKILSSLHKMPFSVIIESPLDLPLLSYRDTDNQTVTRKIFEFPK